MYVLTMLIGWAGNGRHLPPIGRTLQSPSMQQLELHLRGDVELVGTVGTHAPVAQSAGVEHGSPCAPAPAIAGSGAHNFTAAPVAVSRSYNTHASPAPQPVSAQQRLPQVLV